MKKLVFAIAGVAAACYLGSTLLARAQESKAAPAYEYTLVRWMEPDLLYRNIPSRNNIDADVFQVGKQGVEIPKDALRQEFCLTFACKLMARTGWEPVHVEDARITFRRPAR